MISVFRYRRGKTHLRARLFCMAGLLFVALLRAAPDSACAFRLTTPLPGAVIQGAVCTLAVSACSTISSVNFKARFLAAAGVPDSLLVGSITRPPFIVLWNISALPNQLMGDLTLYAEGLDRGGALHSLARQGVFLAHNPALTPRAAASYAIRPPRSGMIPGDLSVGRPSATIPFCKSSVFWNEQELIVVCAILDSANIVQRGDSESCGIQIMIDPSLGRAPFPSDNIYAFFISLTGHARQIFSTPDFNSGGGFTVYNNTVPSSNRCVCTHNGSATHLEFHIPAKTFGAAIPDSFGFNVALILPSKAASPSWSGAEGAHLMCPLLWGKLALTPRPLLRADLWLWLLSYLCGGGLFAIVIIIRKKRRHASSRSVNESLQNLKNQFEHLKTIVGASVTQRSFSINQLSSLSSIPPSRINYLFKRFARLSFPIYLNHARIEIAKERLRSTHASEASIADTCGFTSVTEMEKMFSKYCRITPFKFRKEHQIG
ncbi:MAG: helix-turn-helix domain-containing protein [Chitinivibrionales bacterium]|nr:helix-turn-helix domain-containing protein [Chitinivibrionales bacterium]